MFVYDHLTKYVCELSFRIAKLMDVVENTAKEDPKRFRQAFERRMHDERRILRVHWLLSILARSEKERGSWRARLQKMRAGLVARYEKRKRDVFCSMPKQGDLKQHAALLPFMLLYRDHFNWMKRGEFSAPFEPTQVDSRAGQKFTESMIRQFASFDGAFPNDWLLA